MRLLLDESVPAKLRRHLPTHEVRTAVEMGWSGLKNGKVLALAGQQSDALITVDKNMPFQQNLKPLPVALVVLDAFSNELHVLVSLMPALERALTDLKPKGLHVVRSAV
jgi:predicted nuclease of predicted toxin-antitoxin system